MTALNILVADDRVHVFTDGHGVRLDGSKAAMGRFAKVMPLPHLGVVLACRGPIVFLGLLAIDIQQRAATALDLARSIESGEVAQLTRELAAKISVTAGPKEVELAVAGLLPPYGPAAFWIGPVSSERLSEQPQTIRIPPKRAMLSPAYPGADTADIDLVRNAVAITEAQQAAYPQEVGVFLQHTEIAADGITTRIIHRWS